MEHHRTNRRDGSTPATRGIPQTAQVQRVPPPPSSDETRALHQPPPLPTSPKVHPRHYSGQFSSPAETPYVRQNQFQQQGPPTSLPPQYSPASPPPQYMPTSPPPQYAPSSPSLPPQYTPPAYSPVHSPPHQLPPQYMPASPPHYAPSSPSLPPQYNPQQPQYQPQQYQPQQYQPQQQMYNQNQPLPPVPTNYSPYQQTQQPHQMTKEEKKQAEYDAYLSEANANNFDDLIAYKFLENAGKDARGRPIVVFIASKIPAKLASHDRILLYLIKTLDRVVLEDYVLVYIHSNFRSENQPPFTWIKKCYGLLGRKYKKNLKEVFVVQPTFWVKTVMQCCKPFVSSKFWVKLHYITYLEELAPWLDHTLIKVPSDLESTLRKGGALPSPSKEKKEATYFGQDLKLIMQHPSNTGYEIPHVVYHCVKYLNQKGLEEGIFRISGNKNLIFDLIEQINEGRVIDFFTIPEVESSEVAGILKQYIRDLPDPLLTYALYNEWINAFCEGNLNTTKGTLLKLLAALPKLNFTILGNLMQLMKKIASHSDITKMTPPNLAIVWAPNVLRPENNSPQAVLLNCNAANKIIMELITNCDFYFPNINLDF